MIDPVYRAQAELLLRVLPLVGEEDRFALKGGTAINLFVCDMPRLSVDIDLTYLPFDDREVALTKISEALGRLQNSLERLIPGAYITSPHKQDRRDTQLLCRVRGVTIKIEVNTVIRGHVWPTRVFELSEAAQNEFGMFTTARVVSEAELFGGKICAALDRQHPRDLFDVAQLLAREGISEEIRHGFLVALLSHSRPIHELLQPNYQDQRHAFDTQFAGMTREPFTFEEYISTRELLVQQIHGGLTASDREFLISFKQGRPDWSLFPMEGLQRLPAVQWKLANIARLMKNKRKHQEQLAALVTALET